VLLSGHGTKPEDLAQTRLTHWLQSIRDGYARLAERCEHVFGLGISLSGNFLLTLAPLVPFSGLILIGTPLTFRHERAYRATYRVLRALGKEYQKKWYLEHLDASIRSRRPTYDRFPLACARDCMTAISWSKENLPRIRCPMLILQSTTDHAVDERTVTEFRTRLASCDVTVEWFPNRYHVLVIDHDAEPVFASIARFIQTRTEERTPHAAAPRPLVQPADSLAA
ncbi:MAG: alpha/beta hydrolase, partial [bacterium]|nr:alpha/beta hydrolase [bacterium]